MSSSIDALLQDFDQNYEKIISAESARSADPLAAILSATDQLNRHAAAADSSLSNFKLSIDGRSLLRL